MKKFELLSTQPIKGKINIPVLNAMTYEEVANKIEAEVKRRQIPLNWFKLMELNLYLKSLRNDPERVFIDPCNSEDCFVLSFGFKSYSKEVALFAGLLVFAGLFDSLLNLL